MKALRKNIDQLVSINDIEFSNIRSHFVIEYYKKNEYIFSVGDLVDNCYFVESGLLKLVYEDNDGKDHIVSFAMENWWDSDFAAFLSQSRSRMALQCIEDTTVFSISYESYQYLIATSPKLKEFLIRQSNRGHIAMQNRLISFLTSNAKERYEQLLLLYPQLFQRVPKSYIASYLGVSRETLSRLSH